MLGNLYYVKKNKLKCNSFFILILSIISQECNFILCQKNMKMFLEFYIMSKNK